MTGPADRAAYDREVEDESAAHANEPNGVTAPKEKPRPSDDGAETMQHDNDGAVGRQRYADARPGDYSKDFQEDGSGSHPVKEVPADRVDERGVPDIAATRPPGDRTD